jgi:hypothetical protein
MNQNSGSSGFDSTGVSRDSSNVQFTSLAFTEQGSGMMQRESYSLDRFQLYQPFYRTQLINTSLGNNGNAFQNLIYNPSFNRGLNWGFRTFSAYTFQPEIILDLIYPEKYYTIMLMDSDGGTIFNQDDTIATAIFLPYSPGQSFPSVIALNSQNMKVDVHVKYTW